MLEMLSITIHCDAADVAAINRALVAAMRRASCPNSFSFKQDSAA